MLIKHFQVLKNARSNMRFILKLVLIILLNKTSAHITHDTETVILPAWNSIGTREMPLTLKVFGKQIQLNLRRNDQNVSSEFKVWKHDTKGKTERLSRSKAPDSCYFLHKDHISSAVINFCQEYGWEGLVLLEDDTLEIRPLRDDFASLTLTDDSCVKEENNISFGKPHIIKRSSPLFDNSSFDDSDNFKLKRRHIYTQADLTIEVAVFLDETAYRKFIIFLDYDEEMLRNMILAYLSNVETLLHHPSLGNFIDITLIYLEIMKEQPLELEVGANRKVLWTAFCKYAYARNPPSDSDPGHWDLALLLTGQDLFSIENFGEEDYGVAGSGSLDGLCKKDFSCAIIEFGVNYMITSGFSSTIIAAHEIGHLLGMEHDETSVCEEHDYIMSFRQNQRGLLTWSQCSRVTGQRIWGKKPCLRDRTKLVNHDDPSPLDHSRYHNLPGREWTAKAQCELFYRDKDAIVVSLFDICQTLQCESSKLKMSNFTGPALPGTYCALGKECRSGECVPIIEPPYNFKCCDRDNWSEWKTGPCKSYCLEKSKGVAIKRRFCTHQTYRTANCKGPYHDVVLCNDTSCGKFRTLSNFTQTECTIFKLTAELNKQRLDVAKMKPGKQVSHDVEKPWIACTIFCHSDHFDDYRAPRVEMLEFGVDPYFPDGTWCHHENGQDYYCRQHYCVPESDF